MTRREALDLAELVLDYKTRSYVEAARALAAFVVADARQREEENENLSSTQARCTELLEEIRLLKK